MRRRPNQQAQAATGALGVGIAYAVFLQSIPYSFYAFMAIFTVFLIAYSSRDYGPMLKAEVRGYIADIPDLEACSVRDQPTGCPRGSASGEGRVARRRV